MNQCLGENFKEIFERQKLDYMKKKEKVKEKEIIKEYEKVKIRERLNRINKIKKKR